MTYSNLFKHKPATPEELKTYWASASVHDRKLLINMGFNNSKGTQERVLLYLNLVGEEDTQTYLDYYRSLSKG